MGIPHSGLADDLGAKVPAAAALVIERNVLAGGAGPDEVLLGPGPGGGAPCPACVLSDLLILPVKWVGGGGGGFVWSPLMVLILQTMKGN